MATVLSGQMSVSVSSEIATWAAGTYTHRRSVHHCQSPCGSCNFCVWEVRNTYYFYIRLELQGIECITLNPFTQICRKSGEQRPPPGIKRGFSPYSEWQNSIGWETIADPGPGLPDFQQLSRFHNNNNFINELACGASFSKNRVAGVKQHAG